MAGTAVRVSRWELRKTPVQAWCIWETRCATGTSSIDVPCAARLHLGSFLNLIPGMAFVACTGNSKKPPNPLGKEIFSAELRCQKSRSQLSYHLRWMSLTVGKGRRTIILKPLFGWWLIRAVHHRETNPGVNRCLLWILQPVMKKNKGEHNRLFQFDMQRLGTTTDKSQFVSSCSKTTTQLGIILLPSGNLSCEKSYWWLISAFLRAVLMVEYLPEVLISK